MKTRAITEPQKMLDNEPTQKEYKLTKRDYLNALRRTVILASFLSQYLFRMISVFLLEKGVDSWLAVSIPIVFEFSRIVACSMKSIMKISLKLTYKQVYFIYICALTVFGFILTQCSTPFTILPLVMFCGVIFGLFNIAITNINTQNSRFESFCLITWQRSVSVGSLLGYFFGQVLYDLSPVMFVVGYIAVGVFGFSFNIPMKDITSKSDHMVKIDDVVELTKEDKIKIFLCVCPYAIYICVWCLLLNAGEELLPLVTNKVGYIYAISSLFAIISLCFCSGKFVHKLKQKKLLATVEYLLACIDVVCYILCSIFRNFWMFVFAYALSGLLTSIVDPLWTSIMSTISQNNRKKYALAYKVYYTIRTIMSAVSIVLCALVVNAGVEYFKYITIATGVAIIVLGIVCKTCFKRFFGRNI